MNKHIFGGPNHFFYLVNGKAYGWGANYYGQLGIGNENSPITKPTKVVGFENIVQIACGENHTLFLLSTGEVWATGNNSSGQLGLGFEKSKDTSKPMKADFKSITQPAPPIKYISCGDSSSFAIDGNNNVYGFGSNSSNELGINNNFNTKPNFQLGISNEKGTALYLPVLIQALEGKNIVKVFTSKYTHFKRTFFVDKDGGVSLCFGSKHHGSSQGLQTLKYRNSTALENVESIVTCGNTNYYLQEDNSLFSQTYLYKNKFSELDYDEQFKNIKVNSISACGSNALVLTTKGTLLIKDGKNIYTSIPYVKVKETVAGKDFFLFLDKSNNLFQCSYKVSTAPKKIVTLST